MTMTMTKMTTWHGDSDRPLYQPKHRGLKQEKMNSRLLLVSTQGGEEVMALRDWRDLPHREYEVLRYLYGAVCRIATVALRRGSIFVSLVTEM